jgi:hypothetical protein
MFHHIVGSVVHARPEGEGQYEHSSIISTVVHKLFKPADGKRFHATFYPITSLLVCLS